MQVPRRLRSENLAVLSRVLSRSVQVVRFGRRVKRHPLPLTDPCLDRTAPASAPRVPPAPACQVCLDLNPTRTTHPLCRQTPWPVSCIWSR